MAELIRGDGVDGGARGAGREAREVGREIGGEAVGRALESVPLGSAGDGAARGGRPRVLDAVKRAEICGMIAAGCTFRTVARCVGCSAAAISMLMKRDEEFRDQVGRALAQRELVPLAHLREASKQSWRAAVFLLERTVKGTYRRGSEDDPTDLERLAEEEERATVGEVVARSEERSAARAEERLRRMMEELDGED